MRRCAATSNWLLQPPLIALGAVLFVWGSLSSSLTHLERLDHEGRTVLAAPALQGVIGLSDYALNLRRDSDVRMPTQDSGRF